MQQVPSLAEVSDRQGPLDGAYLRDLLWQQRRHCVIAGTRHLSLSATFAHGSVSLIACTEEQDISHAKPYCQPPVQQQHMYPSNSADTAIRL